MAYNHGEAGYPLTVYSKLGDKMLEKDEVLMRATAEKCPHGAECFLTQAEIIRNARRRYLALRENGVYLDASYEYAFNGEDLDAAADWLLEGGNENH